LNISKNGANYAGGNLKREESSNSDDEGWFQFGKEHCRLDTSSG